MDLKIINYQVKPIKHLILRLKDQNICLKPERIFLKNEY